MPFGPGFGELMAWKMYGGGDKLRNEIYASYGLISFNSIAIGPETSGWFKNEIKSLDQLKGMKMRFFGLGARVMQSWAFRHSSWLRRTSIRRSSAA